MLLAFIFNDFSPFGGKDLFSATHNEDYITNYYRLHDYVHGLYKCDRMADIWSFYMTDPINLLVLVFPRDLIIAVLSLIYIIKIGLAGLSFSIFLDKRYDTTNPLITLLLSTAYALSSFMLIYGANLSILSVLVLFPLIILSLDKLISDDKWIAYYTVLLVSFIFNAYITFVILLFSYLYLLIPNYNNGKHLLKSIIRKLITEVLAIFSTSIFVLPVFFSHSSNNFFAESTPMNTSFINFFDVLKRFLFYSEPSTTTDVDHGIDIYIGLLCIVLLISYILNKSFDIFNKIKVLSILAILVMAHTMTGLNSLFSLNANYSTNHCVFSFELIFIILLITHKVLTNIDNITKLNAIITAVVSETLIVLAIIFVNSYKSTSTFIFSMEIVFAYSIILIIYTLKILNNNKTLYALCILGVIELICSLFISTNSLKYSDSKYENTYSYNAYRVEMYLKSNEKDANIINYSEYDRYFNPVFNYVSGVDYILCPDELPAPDACLRYYNTLKNVDIYENKYRHNGYISATTEILNWTFSKSSPYTSMNSLISSTINEDTKLFEKIDCYPNIVSSGSTDKTGQPNHEITYVKGDYTLSKNGEIYSNYLIPGYIGNTGDSFSISKIYTLYMYYSCQYAVDNNTFYTFDEDTFKDSIEKINLVTNNTEIDNDGYLIVSIKEKPEYDLYIDNKKADYISIDDTLWVTPISKGTHTIDTRKTNLLAENQLSLFISILFILLTLLIYSKKLERLIPRKLYHFIQDGILNNYVYISTVTITAMIFILSCYLKSCIPFGNLSVLAADGYVQTYPGIQYMIDHLSIKSLSPSYISFNTFICTCGGDVISSFISTCIQLFFRLFIWTNDGKLYGAILAAIYLGFSGPSIIFYLTHRYSGTRLEKTNPYLIVIALMYTLCAYTLGYYTYNNFSYGLYVPIIIFALERMLYKKKPLFYVIALSFIMIRGYYTAFLLCEFIGLYFLTFDFKSIKDFLKKLLRFGSMSIISAGIAAFTLLPSFISTTTSPYKGADTVESSDISFVSTIFKSFSQYQVGQTPIIMSPDDGMVNIYAGILPLLFIFIYLFNTKVKRNIRIRKAILLLVLFWAFGDTLLNFVFHGFHFQANVPNRFSIFFIFMIIVIFTDTFISLKEIDTRRQLIPISIFSCIAIVAWMIYPDKNWTSLVLSIIFIAIYLSLFIYSIIYKKEKTINSKLIIYICTIEILLSSTISFIPAIGHLNSRLDNDLKSIGKLTEDFNNSKTDEVFITEYITTSTDVFNMGKVNDINTVTGFSSELSAPSYHLAGFWGLSSAMNNIRYSTGNPVADMMIHVKYQLVNTDEEETNYQTSIYNKIKTHNNIELYENPYYLPIGFMTSSNLKSWSDKTPEDYTSFLDYMNGFSKAVCGKEIYSEITPSEEDDGTSISADISEESQYGTYDIDIDITLDKSISGKLYAFYGNKVDYVGDTMSVNDNSFHFIIHDYYQEDESDAYSITFGILNEDTLSEMHQIFSKNTMTNYHRTNKYLSGEIDVTDSGILYISLPCYDNMNIYVDDKKVDHFQYLNGIGIELDSGHHNIKIEGTNPNYYIGVLISCISIVILIILQMINIKREDHYHENNKE